MKGGGGTPDDVPELGRKQWAAKADARRQGPVLVPAAAERTEHKQTPTDWKVTVSSIISKR